jgi:hypothetical protein
MAIFRRGKGRHGPGHRKSAVVPTKSIFKAANVLIIGDHHILALQSSLEGWQPTPLLERCREHASCRGRVVQRHVLYLGEINDTQEWRGGAVDRGFGGRLRATSHAVAVFGGPL